MVHACTYAVLEHVPYLQVVQGSSYRTQVGYIVEDHCAEYVAGKFDVMMLLALLLDRQAALLFA